MQKFYIFSKQEIWKQIAGRNNRNLVILCGNCISYKTTFVINVPSNLPIVPYLQNPLSYF